jgi:hypothetical protein
MFSLQRSLPPWLRHKPKLLNTFYGGLAVISALVLLRIAATSFSSTSSSSSFDFSGADPHVSSSEWTSRAERVKQAFLHSYHGYEKYALPKDELRPVTNEGMSGFVSPCAITLHYMVSKRSFGVQVQWMGCNSFRFS